MKRKLSFTALTHLGFHITALLDTCPDCNLPFTAIHAAADLGVLLAYLDRRFRNEIDLYLILSDPDVLAEVELALTTAAGSMYGRDISSKGKKGKSSSGLCLVMAIILEAIQQQYTAMVDPPRRSFSELPPPSPCVLN